MEQSNSIPEHGEDTGFAKPDPSTVALCRQLMKHFIQESISEGNDFESAVNFAESELSKQLQ